MRIYSVQNISPFFSLWRLRVRALETRRVRTRVYRTASRCSISSLPPTALLSRSQQFLQNVPLGMKNCRWGGCGHAKFSYSYNITTQWRYVFWKVESYSHITGHLFAGPSYFFHFLCSNSNHNHNSNLSSSLSNNPSRFLLRELARWTRPSTVSPLAPSVLSPISPLPTVRFLWNLSIQHLSTNHSTHPVAAYPGSRSLVRGRQRQRPCPCTDTARGSRGRRRPVFPAPRVSRRDQPAPTGALCCGRTATSLTTPRDLFPTWTPRPARRSEWRLATVWTCPVLRSSPPRPQPRQRHLPLPQEATTGPRQHRRFLIPCLWSKFPPKKKAKNETSE